MWRGAGAGAGGGGGAGWLRGPRGLRAMRGGVVATAAVGVVATAVVAAVTVRRLSTLASSTSLNCDAAPAPASASASAPWSPPVSIDLDASIPSRPDHLRPVLAAMIVRHGARTPITRAIGIDRQEFFRLWGECHSPDTIEPSPDAASVSSNDQFGSSVQLSTSGTSDSNQSHPSASSPATATRSRTTSFASSSKHHDEERLIACGHGQLTQLGELQLYTIGQRLRDMYIARDGLVSSHFVPHELFLSSTDTDRTRLSLIRLVQGLYHTHAPSMRTIKRHMLVQHESRQILAPNFRYCERMRELFVHSLYHPYFQHYMSQPRVHEIASHSMLDVVRARLPVSHESWVPVPAASGDTSVSSDSSSSTVSSAPSIPSPRIFIGMGDEVKCRLAEDLPMPTWLSDADAHDANAAAEFVFHSIFHAGHFVRGRQPPSHASSAPASLEVSPTPPTPPTLPELPTMPLQQHETALQRRTEMLRLSIGQWFGEVLHRMDDAIRFQHVNQASKALEREHEQASVSYLDPLATPHHESRDRATAPPALLLYAAHDSSILPALECLGVVDTPSTPVAARSTDGRVKGMRDVTGQWPPFASNLLFELLIDDKETSGKEEGGAARSSPNLARYHVRVLYNFDPVLQLPFNQFRNRLRPYLFGPKSRSLAGAMGAADADADADVDPFLSACHRRDSDSHLHPIPSRVF